ncbi:MAG: hypothetical protein ACK57E_11735 [Erythrobacteraceae bacterium]
MEEVRPSFRIVWLDAGPPGAWAPLAKRMLRGLRADAQPSPGPEALARSPVHG